MRSLPIILALFVLAGCSNAVAAHVQDARDQRRVPADFVLRWDDHAAAWGGRRIELRGDGALTITRFRPSLLPGGRAPEERVGDDAARGEVVFRGAVQPEALLPLMELLDELRAWETQPSHRPPPLDTSRATLTLRFGDAESRAWEYVSDLSTTARLSRVRDALEALIDGARPLRAPGVRADTAPPEPADE